MPYDRPGDFVPDDDDIGAIFATDEDWEDEDEDEDEDWDEGDEQEARLNALRGYN
jgi:hypothetical protein